MRGWGSQSSTNFAMRSHVKPSFWLRRRSVRRQRSVTGCRNAESARLFVGTAIVGEVASHDLPQPFPLFGDRLVHSAP